MRSSEFPKDKTIFSIFGSGLCLVETIDLLNALFLPISQKLWKKCHFSDFNCSFLAFNGHQSYRIAPRHIKLPTLSVFLWALLYFFHQIGFPSPKKIKQVRRTSSKQSYRPRIQRLTLYWYIKAFSAFFVSILIKMFALFSIWPIFATKLLKTLYFLKIVLIVDREKLVM